MNSIVLCRHPVNLAPVSSRVIIRPFIPSDIQRVTTIIGRVLSLEEAEVQTQLKQVRAELIRCA